ncbi:MAG: IscS subfamily cysteine desulfurase [Bacteroidia bacterium]
MARGKGQQQTSNMIYLDYNSTTPVDEKVLQAMLPYFTEKFGNAASKTHSYGWIAEDAVEQARKQIAHLINAEASEIIFTSGATEAINLALRGVFEKYSTKGNHIITVATEHKAVLDTCKYLETVGALVTYLKVDNGGLIDLNELENAITDKTILVSVMYANNETGVIQNIKEISKIVHSKKCLLMSDATQAVGKISVDVQNNGIDIMSLSAHKIYGPKGIGALYMRRKNPRVILAPLIFGGGHEKGLRSGTLNVPGIVGFGKAYEIAENDLQKNSNQIERLRNKLEHELLKFKNVSVNGIIQYRLPNTSNICFKGIESNKFIKELGDIAVATGSACTSALPEPSHVLRALGLSESDAYSSIRFSLGKYTTEEEINYTVEKIKLLLAE